MEHSVVIPFNPGMILLFIFMLFLSGLASFILASLLFLKQGKKAGFTTACLILIFSLIVILGPFDYYKTIVLSNPNSASIIFNNETSSIFLNSKKHTLELISETSPYPVKINYRYLIYLMFSILIYLLPAYACSLTGLKMPKVRQVVLAALSVMAAVFSILNYFSGVIGDAVRAAEYKIFVSLFILLLFYTSWLIFADIGKIKERENSRLLKFDAVFFSLSAVIIAAEMFFKTRLFYLQPLFTAALFTIVWNGAHIEHNFRIISSRTIISMDIHLTDHFTRKYNITDREKEIIEFMAKGFPNGRIAQELFISLLTVKRHIYNIYQKTGTKSRFELFQALNREKDQTRA